MTLTDEQQRAIISNPYEPVRLTGPSTRREYVLVEAEVYERMKKSLEDFNPEDAYPAIDEAFADGWNDPKMDDYDRYEERKK